MGIEAELFEVLTEAAAVAALVGTRVYPMILPQNPTLPAVVYQEIRTEARAAADGDTGQRESRFQLTWWATSYAAVKSGKAALVGLLSGYRGGSIELITVDAMHDDRDPETGWWSEIADVVVLWKE